MYLITKWFGTFICDKKGIKKKILFSKDEKIISERLQKIKKKQILSEERKIIKDLKVIVNEIRLSEIGEYKPSDPFFKIFDINSLDFGYSFDLLNKVSVIMSTEDAEKKLSFLDVNIIQMINALDDLIQTSNLISERIASWSVIPSAKKKMTPMINLDLSVKKEMSSLQENIEEDMQNIAPNICKIIGPMIGARLIAIAGSLEKLALLPASTIQVLGAEKALFRFKKEGGNPPKHGVIFQYSKINKSPKENRGKIARILSANISIAAKADAFTKRDISKTLIKNIDKKIKKIQ